MADIEQQPQQGMDPTPVMPGGEMNTAPPQGAGYGGGVPSEEFTPFGWVKTPKGILRLIEFLFSMIIFGTMADVSGYDSFSQFQFSVAVGAMLFIYTFCLILCYIGRKTVERYCLYMPPIELTMDGIFTILLLAAGAAVAAKCNEDNYLGSGKSICDVAPTKTKNNIQASAAFNFLAMFCMMASTFLSYKENAAEEAKR